MLLSPCAGSYPEVLPCCVASSWLGLTLPLPDVTVDVIEVVAGHVGDAVQVEEVGLCGQSPEQRQAATAPTSGKKRQVAPEASSVSRLVISGDVLVCRRPHAAGAEGGGGGGMLPPPPAGPGRGGGARV